MAPWAMRGPVANAGSSGVLKLQHHNGHDDRENGVRIRSQPIRGNLSFTHSAPGGVSKASIDINHGREQRHQSSPHPFDAPVANRAKRN